MGLFSFLKNAGASKTKKTPNPLTEDFNKSAEDLIKKQHLLQLKTAVVTSGVDVNSLTIDAHDDVVTVSGKVNTQAEKEKVILALGNVNGVATVDDRIEVEQKEDAAEFYTVEKGDSLSKIAKRYYGDPMKYKELFKANQPLLKDPDHIYPGQVLRIPKNIA